MAATFISGLDPLLANNLKDAANQRTYPARTYIFHEGDLCTGVFLVQSGLLRIDRTTRNGRVALLNLAINGDLIGELAVIDGSVRSASLSTVTSCSLHHVSTDAFRSMLNEDQAIQTAVMERLTRRIRALSTQLLETATMDAPARIASRLVELVEIERTLGRISQSQHEIDLKLPISQEALGQWSGLSREGAAKGLATLRSIGVIETSRMRVKIRDITALRAVADGA